MLERFGLTQQLDGKFAINTRQAIDGATEELGSFFKYKPHPALIQFTAPGSEASTIRGILEQRKTDQAAINECVERINTGTEIGGATLYTGDLELDFTPRPKFMIFISNATGIRDFPFTIGEEITHGEHISNIITDQNISYADYRNRFQELAEEFLGYLGRKRMLQVAGLEESYPLNISLERNMTQSEWAHFLAYTTVDDLIERHQELPVVELFHAPNEARLWQILLEAIKEHVEFNFNFSPTLNYEGLVKPLRGLLKEAKANKTLKLKFSHKGFNT